MARQRVASQGQCAGVAPQKHAHAWQLVSYVIQLGYELPQHGAAHHSQQGQLASKAAGRGSVLTDVCPPVM